MEGLSVQWKKISQGPYEVSNDTRIRRFDVVNEESGETKVFKPLKMYYSENGTISVNIVNYQHKVQKLQLARLVAEAFEIPNPMEYRYIGYTDGDKRNCAPNNLHWTPHRNLNVASRSGVAIKCVETGKVYPSKYALAKEVGVSITRVRQCLKENRPLRGFNYVVNSSQKGE